MSGVVTYRLFMGRYFRSRQVSNFQLNVLQLFTSFVHRTYVKHISIKRQSVMLPRPAVTP